MSDRDGGEDPPAASISSLLFPGLDARSTFDLEAYRVRWERKHGPTDLTRYYTSRWPAAEADQLCQLNSKEYFLGLPPFVQDYLREMSRELRRSSMHETSLPERLVSTMRRLALGDDFDPPRAR